MKTTSVEHVWQQLRGGVTPIFIEIGRRSLKLLDGDEGLEIALERQGNGGLTSDCRERLSTELKGFLKERGWLLRRRALCAVDARGVSLRWVKLPASGREDLEGLLRLQIEKEFPLGPDELAWGYRLLSAGSEQQVLLAALKRDRIEEYATLMIECGLNPTFTLGALIRSVLAPTPPGKYAILDVGRADSELVSFENGVASAVRTVGWGGRHLTEAIQQELGVDFDEAEERKCRLNERPDAPQEADSAVWRGVRTGLQGLVKSVNQCWDGNVLYLVGETARLNGIGPIIADLMGRDVRVESIDLPEGKGISAATQGLRQHWQKSEGAPLLELQSSPDAQKRQVAERHAALKWAAAVVLLLIGSFSLPYIEALVKKPALAKKLSEIDRQKQALPDIDQKIGFLQHLKERRSPYLDIVTLLARAAPDQTLFQSISIKPSGALSLQAKLKQSEQAVELRSTLEKTGFFTRVRLDEQAPADGKRKIQVRLSADWTPSEARARLAKAIAALPKPEPPPSRAGPPGRRGGPPPSRRPDMSRAARRGPPNR